MEFADWCHYCVHMHPWTNDLGWVISPLDNVFVGKMDSKANDTGQFAKYLQHDCIPNLFYLHGDKKKTAPAQKIKFGDFKEDPGPVAHRVESMVRGIHCNMAEPKFPEEKYVQRAKLITVWQPPPTILPIERHARDAMSTSVFTSGGLTVAFFGVCTRVGGHAGGDRVPFDAVLRSVVWDIDSLARLSQRSSQRGTRTIQTICWAPGCEQDEDGSRRDCRGGKGVEDGAEARCPAQEL